MAATAVSYNNSAHGSSPGPPALFRASEAKLQSTALMYRSWCPMQSCLISCRWPHRRAWWALMNVESLFAGHHCCCSQQSWNWRSACSWQQLFASQIVCSCYRRAGRAWQRPERPGSLLSNSQAGSSCRTTTQTGGCQPTCHTPALDAPSRPLSSMLCPDTLLCDGLCPILLRFNVSTSLCSTLCVPSRCRCCFGPIQAPRRFLGTSAFRFMLASQLHSNT